MFDLQGLAAPRESMPKAEAAARKALALDDALAEAHASLAGVLYRYHWDWDNAGKDPSAVWNWIPIPRRVTAPMPSIW